MTESVPISEAAKYLGVSEKEILRMIYAGELMAYVTNPKYDWRDDKNWRVILDSLQEKALEMADYE